MIYTLIFLSALTFNPQPFLLQSTIDAAKMIGLPRMKTMDSIFAKAVLIDELHGEVVLTSYSRLEFLKNYIKINQIRS